jgi:hypothetical protein
VAVGPGVRVHVGGMGERVGKGVLVGNGVYEGKGGLEGIGVAAGGGVDVGGTGVGAGAHPLEKTSSNTRGRNVE